MSDCVALTTTGPLGFEHDAGLQVIVTAGGVESGATVTFRLGPVSPALFVALNGKVQPVVEPAVQVIDAVNDVDVNVHPLGGEDVGHETLATPDSGSSDDGTDTDAEPLIVGRYQMVPPLTDAPTLLEASCSVGAGGGVVSTFTGTATSAMFPYVSAIPNVSVVGTVTWIAPLYVCAVLLNSGCDPSVV